MMIGQIRIDDRRARREYADPFPQVVAQYSGELLCLADGADVMEGIWAHARTAVLRFADEAAALTWYRSPAYQALVNLRSAAAVSNIVLVKHLVA